MEGMSLSLSLIDGFLAVNVRGCEGCMKARCGFKGPRKQSVEVSSQVSLFECSISSLNISLKFL
jgi:hypothetical protein